MDLTRPYPAAGSRHCAPQACLPRFPETPRDATGQNERNSARHDAVTAATDNCKPISLLGCRARPIATASSLNWTGAGDVPFRVYGARAQAIYTDRVDGAAGETLIFSRLSITILFISLRKWIGRERIVDVGDCH